MSASVALLVIAGSALKQPADQEFYFIAQNLMSRNVVRVSVDRYVRPATKPLSWSVLPGSLSLRFVPVSGQKTEPKLIGRKSAFPKPILSGTSDPDVKDETSFIEVQVDWKGCKPGYYRLDASVTLQGEGRSWQLNDLSRTNYWRPMPPELPLLRVSQEFLSTARRRPDIAKALGEAIYTEFGCTLTISEVGPGRHEIPATLRSGQGEYHLTFFSAEGVPTWLEPVFKDDSALLLESKYVGKTVFPMDSRLYLIEDGSASRLRYEKGTMSVVIRGVWRASRRRPGPGRIPLSVLGSNQDLIDYWYPLYVVFDVVSGKRQTDANTADYVRFVTLVSDPWEFERVFSSTSMAQDFGKLDVSELGRLSFRPIEAMTPKQVAWVAGWPVVAAPLEETLGLTEWRYEPRDSEPYFYRFKDGRLLPGKGVN